MVLTALAGCRDYVDDPADGKASGPSLAFCVSTNRGATRMSDNVTQVDGTFRDIAEWYILPFDCDAPVGIDEFLQPAVETVVIPYESTLNYYDDHSPDIPTGTKSFICYARPQSVDNGFIYGSLTASFPTGEGRKTTADITFSPEEIYKEKAIGGTKPSIATGATAIASYLTAIAKATPEEGSAWYETDLFRGLFLKFVNKGHVIAASDTSATKWALWLKQELIGLPKEGMPELTEAESNMKTAILTAIGDGISNDYPSTIFLPEGAAVVEWNTSTNAFEVQVETTIEANINSLDRFIYPAELWYYTNSNIKTSSSTWLEEFSGTWDEVLEKHENDNATVNGGEASIVIKTPLNYAVGLLKIAMVVSSTLTDASETPKEITLKDGKTAGEEATFPLSAVFVSGQHTQNFDFTPKENTDEKIIYDMYGKDPETGKPLFTMGTALRPPSSPTPESNPTVFTNTLVLQTKDETNVRIALEFTNNSGEDFEGANGTVFQGTKFYLVGTIEVKGGHTGDEEFKNRVFTKDRITWGTVTISSLQQAYTYLPDLLDPRLEIGIRLVPDWIQATTTNVPL